MARYQQRWTLLDLDADLRLEQAFGASRATLVDEWRAWRAVHAEDGYARMHTELVVRLWSIGPPDSQREDLGARLGHRLACSESFGTESSLRAAAIERFRAQDPSPLEPATILNWLEFSHGLF